MVSPPSPDELTCDSGMDEVSMAEEDRLRLHAACLEGRLSVYGREADTWLRERAELSAELASLRKQFDIVQANQREFKEQTDQRVAEAVSKSREVHESLATTKQELVAKMQEAERLESTLSAARQESTSLRTQLMDAQQNNAAKEQAISSLKTKLSELYADLEGFRNAHAQALDSETDLNAELASLRRSQEWYSEQLQLTQAARERLQNELNSMRKWLDQGGTSAQQLAQENARLETQVLSGEAALAEAKRNLSRQLESIRADIVEREAVFEKIAAERSSLESLCSHKSIQITELQGRLLALQGDLNESDLEISNLRTSLNELKQTFYSVESERDNLRATLASLEAQLNSQKIQMDEQLVKYKQVCAELNNLEGNSQKMSTQLDKALEEKAVLDASLQATYNERANLDSCLNHLKDEMSRVETNFHGLQVELDAKNSELGAVLVMRDELSSDMEVLQATLEEKIERIKNLVNEKEHLQNTCLSLQGENEGLRDDMRKLQESIAPACEEAAKKASEPLTAELEKASSLSEALRHELAGLRDQVASLLVEQERHCALLAQHQELQKQYDDLQVAYNTSVDQARTKEAELSQKFLQLESTCSQSLLIKSSEIEALTLQLSEKTTESLSLQSEIASTKALHQQALTQQANEWTYRLHELESQLQAAESQRSDIQQQLQAVLAREHNTLTQHQVQLADLRAEASRLQSRAAIADSLESKHRHLLSELESTKGREMGLFDAMEGLKRHATHLENTLSQREADVAELKNRAERAEMFTSEPVIAPVVMAQPVFASPPSLPPQPCSSCQQLTSEVAWHSGNTSRIQEELVKVQAALDLTRQELAAQSAKTANETFARQKANEAKRAAAEKAEGLERDLAVTKEALGQARHSEKVAEANALALKSRADANGHSNSSEIQALQSIIQVRTSLCLFVILIEENQRKPTESSSFLCLATVLPQSSVSVA